MRCLLNIQYLSKGLGILVLIVIASQSMASPLDLVVNSGFDVDLSGWTVEGVTWSPEDVDGDPQSGSAFLARSLIQCVDVEALAAVDQKVKIRYATPPQQDDAMLLRVFWFTDGLCDFNNPILGQDSTTLILDDTDWHEFSVSRQVPPIANRGALQVVALPSTSNPMIHVDDARLDPSGSLFCDGFESGDTSAW